MTHMAMSVRFWGPESKKERSALFFTSPFPYEIWHIPRRSCATVLVVVPFGSSGAIIPAAILTESCVCVLHGRHSTGAMPVRTADIASVSHGSQQVIEA
ncbi:MAG: hypothetical protein ACK4E7_08035 [Permianibacter sp.]